MGAPNEFLRDYLLSDSDEYMKYWKELRKRKTVNVDELMAYLSVRFGIRRQTIAEYPRDKDACGLIEWKSKTIKWIGEEKWKAETEE